MAASTHYRVYTILIITDNRPLLYCISSLVYISKLFHVPMMLPALIGRGITVATSIDVATYFSPPPPPPLPTCSHPLSRGTHLIAQNNHQYHYTTTSFSSLIPTFLSIRLNIKSR